ncbi:MAG TPA: CHAT domain-containing protein [Thermoanaerobaculia bacterium]|jgi:hypothetical protein|nr:CHAT domain-containing protein [Thermoanaerobaculia bacterium]
MVFLRRGRLLLLALPLGTAAVLGAVVGLAAGAEPPAKRDVSTRRPPHRIFRAPAGVAGGPHVRGAAEMVLSSDARGLDQALARLDSGMKEAPSDPALANDVAALLIQRAGRGDRPADLVAALEILDDAVRQTPKRPALLFNRALALEKLQLLFLARQAWAQFLDEHRDPAWDAARAHLEGIELQLQTRAVPGDELLQRAADAGDRRALAALAAAHPRQAREHVFDVALPAWGKAVVEGNEAEASRRLSAARVLGEELARLGGDGTAAAAVAAIEDGRRRSRTEERALARAHAVYGEARAYLRSRDYQRAAPLLAEAIRSLGGSDSPLHGWCLRELGSIEFNSSRNEAAVSTLTPLLDGCSLERQPALCGRAAWALGLALFRLGRLGEALHVYRQGAAAFEHAREPDNEAAVRGLVAETLRTLGDTDSAWQERFRALRELGGQNRHRSLHNVLWEAGEAALEEGYPLAADLFAAEDVAWFGDGQDSLLALESHLRRALVGQERATAAELRADLEGARDLVSKLPPSTLAERAAVELRLAEAELTTGEPAPQRERGLNDAVTFFRAHRLPVREGHALLARARLRREGGRTQEAQADLQAALRLFETQRTELLEPAERRLYSETWQAVYDELIAMAVARPDGAEEALRLLERSRAVDGIAGGSIPSVLPPSTVVLAYAVRSDAVDRFELTGRGVELTTVPMDRSDLAHSVRAFEESLRVEGRPGPAAAALGALLLPADLPDDARLCIVPDRELSGLPFAALPLGDGSETVVIRHAVVMAQALGGCAASPERYEPAPRDRVLLTGAPRLDPGEFPRLEDLAAAADEVDTLHRLYASATVLTGPQATAPAILGDLPEAAVWHFAGHAVTHPTQPSRSFLPLAPDPRAPASLLSAADVAKLHLPHLKLAVLSACHTVESMPRRAEGISGLVRALLDAGAAAVVGTLWSVEDRSSSALLVAFHRELQRGDDPAEALREAQLQLIRSPDPDLRNPATWAAYEVVVNSVN